MAKLQIGALVHGDSAQELLELITRMEGYGIHAAWITNSGARHDGIAVMAVAATQTRHIKLGTSIVPIYPRHPLIMAAQARVVADLAPGRFRLGIGPSHRAMIEAMGLNFHAPLAHVREYLQILNALLKTGSVAFDGAHYKAHDRMPAPVDLRVMAAALRRNAFELCGEIADGAVSWLCPGSYLRDVALPAKSSPPLWPQGRTARRRTIAACGWWARWRAPLPADNLGNKPQITHSANDLDYGAGS
jgi:alkanesulfonate monooxygenase SsuD/methylene tetrahydromethanopterin reductase-like flavin-dependent oxidoreductase (luciferase family)